MANVNVDVNAKFLTAQRRRAAQFKCTECTQSFFPSEASWWKHMEDAHAEQLAEFTTDEALDQFRSSRLEECRIHKTRIRTEQDQSVESSHHGQNPASPRPTRGGITRGIETLRLEKQQTEVIGIPEDEVGITETPISPTATYAGNLVPEPGNKRPRATQQKGGRGGSSNTGYRKKIDPEFVRQESEAPKHRRLFDYSQPLSAHKAEENMNIPRLENTPTTATSAQIVARGPGRQRKENKKPQKVRTEKPPQHSEVPGLGREGGQRFILPRVLEIGGGNTQRQSVRVSESNPMVDDPSLLIVKQPETRPITSEQLVSEVKGIYAGLEMVESKCVEVDEKQASLAKAMEQEGLKPTRLTNEQWQALIALHRTLLHEHHDFFLASQHPSSSPPLRRLAAKYNMPSRMWRHGVYSFLELLRRRLPHSLEHMLTFIYLAYSIVALLYETVPAFEDTWIECLGDLGRYRMAIEDDDVRDREVWTNVSRTWYSKAADKRPTVGRLYHHIAILAKPNDLQQLFFYSKSLTVGQPFHSARESILSLFESMNKLTTNRSVDRTFVMLHGIWFTHVELDRFEGVLDDYLGLLDNYIGISGQKWTVQGCLIAVCNIAALYEYNSQTSRLRQAWKEGIVASKEEPMEDAPTSMETTNSECDTLLPPLPLPHEASSEHATPLTISSEHDTPSSISSNELQSTNQKTKAYPVTATIEQEDDGSSVPLQYAIKMSFKILELVLERIDDNNVLPHVHTYMAFLFHLSKSIPAMRLIEQDFPFQSLATLLNSLTKAESEGFISQADSTIHFETLEFPKRQGRPLPEDWTLRGLEYTMNYFPDGWIEGAKVDDEERLLELPSFLAARKERILWLGYMIAQEDDWLAYNTKTDKFSVHPALLERIRCKQEATRVEREADLPSNRQEPESDTEPQKFIEDDDFEDAGQSEEVKQFNALKKKRIELQTQLAEKPVGEQASQEQNLGPARKVPPRDALRPGYTVIVVDTNFMLNSLEIVKLTIANNVWSIVIPNTVMTELVGLRSSSSVGVAAHDALATIQASITAKRDLRIITAKGSNVTNISGFYKEKLQDDSEDASIDDVIIAITQSQGKIQAELMETNYGSAQPAVLVTDDTNMRVKANAKNVFAISGMALKSVLQPQAPKAQSTKVKGKININRSDTMSNLASLKHDFPEATEETRVTALNEADGNLQAAEMKLYANRHSNSSKKRHKIGAAEAGWQPRLRQP